MTLVDKLPYEPLPAASQRLKDEQAFSRLEVVANGEVASVHSHVTLLPLTKVMEDSILVVVVEVAMAASGATREEKDVRLTTRCRYAVLPLTPKAVMDIALAVVNSSDHETSHGVGRTGNQAASRIHLVSRVMDLR